MVSNGWGGGVGVDCGRSPWQEGCSCPSWLGGAERRAKECGGVHSLQAERSYATAVEVKYCHRAKVDARMHLRSAPLSADGDGDCGNI